MLKKLIFSVALLLCTVLSFSQDFPAKSNTLVTDYTNTLSAEEKGLLEQRLVAFNDSTSIQIAVVIMQSTGGYDINQYAALLGRKWGVGDKAKSDGIMLLVAIKDRKVAIQTGRGAEGQVPDGVTHDIIYKDILPAFKTGNYYGGIEDGTNQLMMYMKEGHIQQVRNNGQTDGGGGWVSFAFVGIIVIFIIIAIFRRRGGGGGGHIIGGRGGASPFWWFLAGSALGSSNNSGNDWGGFSGGSGGSSDSGGGSDFGGFGGGDFGGGGSSGSW